MEKNTENLIKICIQFSYKKKICRRYCYVDIFEPKNKIEAFYENIKELTRVELGKIAAKLFSESNNSFIFDPKLIAIDKIKDKILVCPYALFKKIQENLPQEYSSNSVWTSPYLGVLDDKKFFIIQKDKLPQAFFHNISHQ